MYNNFVNQDTSLLNTLDLAQRETQTILELAANSPGFGKLLRRSFGSSYDSNLAKDLTRQWKRGDFSEIPEVELLNRSILRGANGAFAGSTQTIYLAKDLLRDAKRSADISGVVGVLLEETGHFVDDLINPVDTSGDEGELFSALVRGIELSNKQQKFLRIENDHATFSIETVVVNVEQSSQPYEDEYLVGDWDGDGKDNIAVRRGNQILMDFNYDGRHDRIQTYGHGNLEDEYLVGDWDGDGKDNIAVRRGNQILMDFNYDGRHDRIQTYGHGNLEDEYLVGDWDGDGKDNIAVRRGNQILMDFNYDGRHDRIQTYGHGNLEDEYLVGDWDGDGKDNIAVRRGNQILMDFNYDGRHDRIQTYGHGNLEDEYLVGDWDGDGKDNIAVRRGNQILMDFNYDWRHDRIQTYGFGTKVGEISPNPRYIYSQSDYLNTLYRDKLNNRMSRTIHKKNGQATSAFDSTDGDTDLSVYALVGGVVIEARNGQRIRDWKKNGTIAIYNQEINKTFIYWHFAAGSINESLKGQTIAPGALIGKEGDTGYSDGVHTHVEVHQGRVTIDMARGIAPANSGRLNVALVFQDAVRRGLVRLFK